MAGSLDARELRDRLTRARLMLLFTPELVRAGDPLAILEAVLAVVDVVQIRPKPLENARTAVTPAREAYEITRAALDLARALPEPRPLVIVNDRVDVARALLADGVAGVHLGQDDAPASLARAVLGPAALVGLSTHDAGELVLAEDAGADYVGFGPIHTTATKALSRGVGAERAWVASHACACPLFAIGGIDRTNVADLAEVGRVAIGAGILGASDPVSEARQIRDLLVP